MKYRIASRLGPLSVLLLALGCGGGEPRDAPAETTGEATPRPGGRLVVAVRAEPQTFNPLLPHNTPSRTVLERLGADLVHIDRETQRTVPALAESWEVSDDGRRYTLKLRQGVLFSDGEPFDADDVVFTYRAVLDEEVGSPNRSLLVIDGEPIAVSKVDPYTVTFDLPAPYAVGERMFDSIPILPEHRLGAAYEEGRLVEVWGLDSDLSQIVGLGPFRPASYVAADRLVLERNPHYWKVDEAGQRLPYLDELVFLFVADEDAQVVKLQAGEIDVLSRLNAANFGLLERQPDLVTRDLGPSLQYAFVFFNLNDLSDRDLPRIAARQKWFRNREFRQAVSRAIDREALANLVFEGRATPLASNVTPADKLWRNEKLEAPRQDLEAARALLAEGGFVRADDGTLLGPEGEPVAFTLMTNSSNQQRVQMTTIIREDLAELGIEVSVVALDFAAMVQRVTSTFDYDACLLAMAPGDVDPNPSLPALLSDGSNHLWDLAENRALPPWQREIDQLLKAQLSELDRARRKEMWDRVQQILAEELPMIFLVSPNVLVAAKRDLGNFRPAVLQHQTLWNVDELYWKNQSTTVE